MGYVTTKSLTRIAGGLALLALAALPARAQTPTPEGTVITNTVTVTFTDANNNTYTPVTGAVSVTVGFLGGINLTASATAAPASPSTGNTYDVAIKNAGNGTDSVALSQSAVPAGLTITGYKVGGTTYGTLAALNAALAATPVASGATVTVQVIYDVANGYGGTGLGVTFTATSRRDATKTANQAATFTPPISRAISVTPHGGVTRSQLPSNGTNYTETYVVKNNGNLAETVDLTGAFSAGAIGSIVSVNGVGGAVTSIALNAGAQQSITIVYSVGNVGAGTTEDLRLTGASHDAPATSDLGFVTVAVVRPSLTLTKQAYRDNQTTLVTTTVLPGEYIQYKITVTNSGTAPSSTVSVSDPLPAQVTYDSYTTDGAGWTITQVGGTVTGDLAGTLAGGASRFFWIRVKVN